MCPSITAEEKSKDDGFPKVKHMIDTHIHIYDTEREKRVPWPPETDTVLYKPHMPKEFNSVSKPTGLTGVVIVEATHRLEDNDWVLDLVKDDPFYVGLVGNLDLDLDPKVFSEQLNEKAKDKRFVGIRARKKTKYDFTDATVLTNLRTLAKKGLSVDILCAGSTGPEAGNQVDQLAKEIPELRIVVDHVFGYLIDGKEPNKEWVESIEKAAKNPNVFCKVSGLYQRCIVVPAPTDTDHYRSVLDVIWKNFGKERVIYGSNWPCTKRSGDYASFVRMVNGYFSEKGQDAAEHYFWKNANRAYRLGLE